jgi:hypothetical protein
LIFVQFDREHFSEVFVDLKWFESKVGNKYLNEAAGAAAEEAKNCKEKRKPKVSHQLQGSFSLFLPFFPFPVCLFVFVCFCFCFFLTVAVKLIFLVLHFP